MATERGQIEATAAGWSREEVLQRITDLVAEFFNCLSDGEVLDLEALKRTSSAMTYDHETKQQSHGNKTRLIKLNRQGGRRYTGIWIILQMVHALLTEHKTASQRDIYYLHPFFKGQSEADEAILDAGSTLGVPRGCMNIVGASRGCFTGDISLIRDNQSRHFGSGEEVSIPQELLQLTSEIYANFFLVSVARA